MDKSKFIVVLAFMLALFLVFGDVVEAADTYEVLLKTENTVPISLTYKFDIGAEEIIAVSENGTTSTLYSYTSGVLDYTLDTGAVQSLTLTSTDVYNYDYISFRISPNFSKSSGFVATDTASYRIIEEYVKPYLVINGEKYYLKPYGYTDIIISPHTKITWAYVGFEVDISIAFTDLYESVDDIRTLFGSYTFSLSLNTSPYELWGYLHLSSGENLINDSVNTQGNAITNALTEFKNLVIGYIDEIEINLSGINGWVQSIFNKLEAFRSESSAQLNTITLKIIDIYNAIVRDYDSTNADDTNTSLSGSLDSWTAAEGQTIEDAQVEVVEYDTASAFDFAPALVSSLTLITSFSNAFFVASGDFSTALIVMIALVFVSVVVGLVRFVK